MAGSVKRDLETDRNDLISCLEYEALSGKDENGNNRMYRLGHFFFFVINPEFFMGLDTFRHTSGDILRALRDSEKAPGQDRIYTAGEKEYLAWLERRDKGVPVGEAIQKEFIALRDACGLDYVFPFEQERQTDIETRKTIWKCTK